MAATVASAVGPCRSGYIQVPILGMRALQCDTRVPPLTTEIHAPREKWPIERDAASIETLLHRAEHRPTLFPFLPFLFLSFFFGLNALSPPINSCPPISLLFGFLNY